MCFCDFTMFGGGGRLQACNFTADCYRRYRCYGNADSDDTIVCGMMGSGGRHGHDRGKDDDRAPSDWNFGWDFELNG